MGDSAESVAAGVWLIRERTEHEAAALFDALAWDLDASGAPEELSALARRCAEDERNHAVHCRRIVDALAPGQAALPTSSHAPLGPAHLDVGSRALYTSIAMGCITESLSTALLIEMRPHVVHDVVRAGLDVIVRDEVRHSRLGWAHVAHAAAKGDVSWIAGHVPGMLRAALPMDESPASGHDLRAYGILPRDEVRRVCEGTISATILPGLALHGIDVTGRQVGLG